MEHLYVDVLAQRQYLRITLMESTISLSVAGPDNRFKGRKYQGLGKKMPQMFQMWV